MMTAHMRDIQVLESGCLTDLVAGAASSQARRQDPVFVQMLFLHSRCHKDPRMPLLQHHLNAMDHRGAVHSLRVDRAEALADAMTVVHALLRRCGKILVVQDGVDLRQAHIDETAPGSYLLLAAHDHSALPVDVPVDVFV